MPDPAREDRQMEQAVLSHVLDVHPATLRLADLLRELGEPGNFAQLDAVERAVRELVKGGLLFRCEGAVLPTRSALYARELLDA